jgi:hypothetical protein
MRTLTHLALLVLSTALLFACENTGSGSDGPVSTSATDSATSSDSASSDITPADAPAGDTAVSTDTTATDTETEVSQGEGVTDAATEVSQGEDVTVVTDTVSSDAAPTEDASASDATSDATQPEPEDTTSAVDAEPNADTTPDVVTDITQEVTEDAAVVDPCEECLANGGTWQPPAGCTQDCNIPDLSCFTSACPEPCSAQACGSCFGQEECKAVGCTWNAEGPAMWCN